MTGAAVDRDDMAFEFDSDGFLTEPSGELEKHIHATHRDFFARAKQINRDRHELVFSIDVHNRDGEAIIIATLFIRVLDHYQATIIFLGRGLIAAGRVTLRALVEATFKISAIATNPGAFKKFIAEDLAHRKKLINKARNNAYRNLEETRKAITNDRVKELEEEIKRTGARVLSTEEWSKLASMHDWYTTNYALLSQAVHTPVRELEDYLELGESGEIRQFNYAPSMNDIPLLLLTATHSLLIAASAFDKRFEVGFGPKGDKHIKFVEDGFRTLNDDDSLPAS